MKNSALLVVDMQVDLCHDPRRSHLVDEIMPALQRLIGSFCDSGMPVLYSIFELDADDEQFRRFGDRYCIKGTHGAEIIPEMFPLRGPVISKEKHSAFFETELDAILKELKVGTLYLAGLQTQICIMTTAADASFRGYRPVAVDDCVVSSDSAWKTEALRWIEKYVGDVETSLKIISELRECK